MTQITQIIHLNNSNNSNNSDKSDNSNNSDYSNNSDGYDNSINSSYINDYSSNDGDNFGPLFLQFLLIAQKRKIKINKINKNFSFKKMYKLETEETIIDIIIKEDTIKCSKRQKKEVKMPGDKGVYLVLFEMRGLSCFIII